MFDLSRGVRPGREGHGKNWQQGAEVINRQMGAGFVTEHSDEDYVCEANKNPIHLLIKPLPQIRPSSKGGEVYGWRWLFASAARLSPLAEVKVSQELLRGARLITTTDEKYLLPGGKGRIGKRIDWMMARVGTSWEPELQRLWEPSDAKRQQLLKNLVERS